MTDTMRHTDTVKKKTHTFPSMWQTRTLAIDEKNIYYSKGNKRSVIPITSITKYWCSQWDTFNVEANGNYVYTFKTYKTYTADDWITFIRKAIKRLKKPVIHIECEPVITPDVGSDESKESDEPDVSSDSDESKDSDESEASKQRELDLQWLQKLCNAITADERNAITDIKMNEHLKKLDAKMEFDDVLKCCFELVETMEKICDDLKTIRTKKYDELVDHQIGHFVFVISRLTTPYNLRFGEMDCSPDPAHKIGYLVPTNILKLIDFYECFNQSIHNYEKTAKQIDNFIDEMVIKYVTIIKTNIHTLTANISRLPQKTIRTLDNGLLETMESHDVDEIMTISYNIIKDHKSVSIKLAVLSTIFSEITYYVCDTLIALLDLISTEHIQYVCAVANDVGFFLDKMENYESIANELSDTECAIKGDITRSQQQVMNAGYQICKIIQSIIAINIDEIMDNMFDKWVKCNIMATVHKKLTDDVVIIELKMSLTNYYFEKTMEMLLFHIVEVYIDRLFKLLRSQAAYKFDKIRVNQLQSDIGKITMYFNEFLDRTMVGFAIKIITMIHKTMIKQIEDVITFFEAELVEFPNHVYYVYMLMIECVKHHSSINKKLMKEFVNDANCVMKEFIIKNPASKILGTTEIINSHCIECEKITLVLLDKLYPDAIDNYEAFLLEHDVTTPIAPVVQHKRYHLESFLSGIMVEAGASASASTSASTSAFAGASAGAGAGAVSDDKPGSPIVMPVRPRRRPVRTRLFDD